MTATPGIVTAAEKAAYDKAFSLLKQSRYADAALEFETFLREHPSGGLNDDAWYWMAQARYVMREFESALNAYQTIANYFPESSRVPAALLKIGYIQYEMAAYPEARQTLSDLLQRFPAHRVAVSAETRLKKMDREGR
jgi:tol-pal system protein YbgF